MIPVAIPHSHTKIGRYYAVAETEGVWSVYQIDEESLLKQDPYSPLLGELLSTFPADDHRQRSRAFEYAEFLSGGTNRSIEAKFSAILNILSKQTMTITEILQKEDDAAAEVGKLVTAFQNTSAEVADLQSQITALQGTQVTDAQLQALADKADSIKQAADAALPAATPASPAPTDSGTGTDTTGTQSGS